MDERNLNQRILVEIAEALTRTTHLPLREIELRCEAETVILHGSVPTYFLKQLAQTTTMSVRGVRLVSNQLRVTDGEQQRSEKQPENAIDLPPISVHETPRLYSRAVLAYA
jgi:hypothetical protein